MNKLEHHLYATAAQEVAAKKFVPALMAKAFSDADGDEKKTIARYIKLRVQHLAEEFVAAQTEAETRQARQAKEREHRQRADAEAELRRSGDPRRVSHPHRRTARGICRHQKHSRLPLC
jgi:hypothetical protein